MPDYRKKAYLYLLITAVLWGIATPVIKFTLGGIEPLSFLLYRFLISALIALIFLVVDFKSLKTLLKNLPRATLYSLLAVTISLVLLFLGLEKTTVLDTILITAVTPLLSALFGYIFLNETITKQEKLGIGIAFTGTVITIIEPVINNGMDSVKLSGNILVAGYLIANAYSSVEAKKLVRNKVNSIALSNYSFIVGFLSVLIIYIFREDTKTILPTIQNLSIPHHLGVIYMAIFSGTIAYALWIKGQKSIEVSEAGVFAYLIPIFAAPLAVFWLGETISPIFIVGAVTITIGVIFAESKRRFIG